MAGASAKRASFALSYLDDVRNQITEVGIRNNNWIDAILSGFHCDNTTDEDDNTTTTPAIAAAAPIRGLPELGQHIIKNLMQSEFDVATAKHLPEGRQQYRHSARVRLRLSQDHEATRWCRTCRCS